jgi:transposase-like protein
MTCVWCAAKTVSKNGRDRRQAQVYRCQSCRRSFTERTQTPFSGYQFPADVIALAVRWYLRYRLSYADTAEWLAEQGISVDPSTIYEWVHRFTPLYQDAARRYRYPVGRVWSVDELRHEVACVAVETTKGGLNRACCRPSPTGACGRSNPAVREPSGQCSLARPSGGHTVRDDRDCQHRGGRELGVMVGLTQVNRCKRRHEQQAKGAERLGPKGMWAGVGAFISPAADTASTGV